MSPAPSVEVANPPRRRGWHSRWGALGLALLVSAGAGLRGWHLSLARQDQLLTQERAQVQNRLNGIGTTLTSVINRRQALVAGLVAFAELRKTDEALRREFELYAAGLQANDPVIRAIQIYPAAGSILTYPLNTNEAVQGRTLEDLINDERPAVRADVARAIQSRRTTLSNPYELRQGGPGVVARQSVVRDGAFWGLVVVVLNVEPLMESAGLPLAVSELKLALRDSAGQVFFGDPRAYADAPVFHRVPLPEGAWTLAAVPQPGWGVAARANVALFRLSAVLVALLLGGLTYAIARRYSALMSTVRTQSRALGEHKKDHQRLLEEAAAARAVAEVSRAQIADTVERISDGFATLDRAWRYTYVNAPLARSVGRRREDLVGQHIWTVFPQAVGTLVYDAYHRAMAEQTPLELEHFYPPLSRWFQHRFYPSPSGLSVFSRDITDRKLAEDTLRASEEQFRRLVREAPLPLCFVAQDETLRLTNDRFVRVFGYTLEDIPTLGRWWERAYPDPGYRQQVIAQWGAAVAQAARERTDVANAEYRVTCKDGSVRLVEISGIAMHDGFLATFVDVTGRRHAEEQTQAAQTETARLLAAAEMSREVLLSVVEDQKEAQAALGASEERYRNLVETSFDWVWEVDTQARYTYASPRVRDLLGFAPEEVLGRSPFDLMPDAEAARLRAEYQQIAESRQPFAALENVNRHRDGRLVVLETSGVPVFAADGTWLGYRGMDRDITVRRAAEKTLRLHGAALEAAANAVVITDRTGAIEWVNPAFTTLSGWTLAEVAGRNPREVVKSGEHSGEFYRKLWDAVLAGRVWRGEIVNRRKDGKLRTEDMTITPLRDPQGEITHFIAIKQDITDHKAMEQQFLQAQRMEAIGTLAGGIAHDLNNILAPIMMITGVLRDKLAEEGDREMLAMTQTSAKRGADIVKQLLAFSRGHAGDRSIVQPRHLIKEMVQMMRETFPREIDLRQQTATNLWTVEADPTQLHQVLLNLCVNARDAMPTGGRLLVGASNLILVEGAIVLPPGARPGPYVMLEVGDTGGGIPPEIKHRIFDPFFTTKPIGKGTGLGLSTVLGIVQSHGGFVTVDSVPGQGSTFKVHLPAIADGIEAADETPAAPTTAPTPGSAGQTILVVDDEREVRDVLRVLLERQDYRVLTATHGADALTQYLQHRTEIRLVLADLMMPVMNGVALVRALRAIDPALKIVVTSGLTDVAQRQELATLGAPEVLMKPYEGAVLLEIVRSRLTET